MTTLTAKITTSIVADLAGTPALALPDAPLTKSYVASYANGAGANQAQAIYSGSRTIAGSGTDNLDLSGLLTDALGNVVSLTGVKEIIIANTGASQIRVGKKITNGFAGPFDQTAGSLGVLVEVAQGTSPGMLRLSSASAAGWAVVGATGDLLSIENMSATGATYDVIIIGK